MKIRKTDLLFYLSYICLYIALFMGDIYNMGIVENAAKILRLVSYGFIILALFFYKLNVSEFLKLVTIFLVTFLYGISTGDLYWSIMILLIYSSKRVNIRTIFRISLNIIRLGTAIVLFLCFIGVIPDVITTRSSMETSEFIRHSLGFDHSNVLPLLLLYSEIYYLFIQKDNIDMKVILGFSVIAIFLNVVCNSRNAFILTCSLSMSIAFEKYIGFNKISKKMIFIITKYSVPVMSVFSYAMMFLLLKGGIWNSIDSLFSGRFRLAIFKMRRVGLHIINFMSNEDFIKDNVTYVNGKMLGTIVLDNGYLYVIFRYGILIVFFYYAVSFILTQKVRENLCLLMALLTVFTANFIDNDLVDYLFLPFILWAFNDLSFDGIVSKVKNKVKIRMEC